MKGEQLFENGVLETKENALMKQEEDISDDKSEKGREDNNGSLLSTDEKSKRFHKADKMSKGPPWYRSQRYILAYVLFGGMMNLFIQRTNFSVAIVCMVNHTATSQAASPSPSVSTKMLPDVHKLHPGSGGEQHGSNHSVPNSFKDLISFQSGNVTARNANHTNTTNQSHVLENSKGNDSLEQDLSNTCTSMLAERAEDGPLNWDKEMQGLVLGSLFWSYFVTSLPLVEMLRRFTRKRVIAVSAFVFSFSALFLHAAALWSPWALFTLKMVQGLCVAPIMMNIYGFWTQWAPPDERTGLVALGFSGSVLANSLAFPLSALLCKYGFFGGWPSVFYVFGLFGIVWLGLFLLLTTETPAEHPWITADERNYIETSLSNTEISLRLPVPWRSVLTSAPVWGMVCTHVSFAWGLLLFLAVLPQYMKEVLKFNINSNGFYSMLPYLTMLTITNLAGRSTNALIRRKTLPLLWIRKIICIIGNLVPACLLVVMSFLDCSQSGLAVFLLTASVGISGIQFSSFLVNPYDIAPLFAQPIITMSNTLAIVPGAVAPYLVGAITKDKTREQWQIVFFLTAGIYTLGAIGFCVMGKAHVQSWAEPRRPSIVVKLSPNDQNEDSDLLSQHSDGHEVKICAAE